ncbi:hypothetical protein CB1_000312001 [Camelus ferus]|nr:hypothetical protein CB1_000312001 [Camelus ferus]
MQSKGQKHSPQWASVESIGRTLIPRYFSTVFEGGVTDLYYILKHSKESYHNSSITVDCDQCAMVTQHGKPMFTKAQDPQVLDQLSKNITRMGLTNFTLNYLREKAEESLLFGNVVQAYQGLIMLSSFAAVRREIRNPRTGAQQLSGTGASETGSDWGLTAEDPDANPTAALTSCALGVAPNIGTWFECL